MNRFLQDSDYDTLLRREMKDLLTETYDDTKLLTAESMAIGQIRNYLKGRYDVDLIFTVASPIPTLDPRDQYLVMIVLDLAIYHLYSSLAPNLIPDHRSLRYEDALKWLRSVSKGELIADLPQLTNSDGAVKSPVRIGSKYPPKNHRW